MKISDLRTTGHWPTLVSAFLYFDVSFMIWVVLGPLALYLTHDLGLSVEEKFGIVAIPILFGAAFRVPLGMLADQIGPKRAGQAGQVIVMAGLAYAWLVGLHSKLEVELLGVVLGVAGASFAVALPQASRWYPPRAQGLVLGLTGAANMGVVLDSLIVPWWAEQFGWQAVFGMLLIPAGGVFILYSWMAKDVPNPPSRMTVGGYGLVLKDPDTWWFMFFYGVTFGGFVGLSGALPLYFTQWYHASGIAAGLMVALIVLAGSLFRPVGGWLADRVGGIKTLQMLFAVVALMYVTVALLPEGPRPPGQLSLAAGAGWGLFDLPGAAWAAVAIFFLGASALGMGNGSVFQLVPLRFRREIGVMTGLVGAAGGLGGFLLARTLGWSRGLTGEFTVGFLVFSVLACFGLVGLVMVKTRWRTTWGAVSGARV